MDPKRWIAEFATAAGAEPPTDEQIDQMLKLASVAAHSSERIAAPVACWIAGSTGMDLREAEAIAQRIAD
jgi:hypothetical protein